MITIIDSLNLDRHPGIVTEMHRLRARVFGGRLGWDVQIVDGQEKDRFDLIDPAHVVSIDEDGNVVGCMRLLQTTGPHMLADVFSSILDGEPPLRSATLWEATRFCVDTERLHTGRGPNSVASVTSEVMIGAFEFAMSAGVTDAVAVIDPVMNRVLKRSGNAPYDYVGSAKPMGKVFAMAALMDCSEERVASIRDYAGIGHDVFMSAADVAAVEAGIAVRAARAGASCGTVIEFAAARRSGAEVAPSAEGLLRMIRTIRHPALRSYCFDQIGAATDPADLAATVQLVEEVIRAQPQ